MKTLFIYLLVTFAIASHSSAQLTVPGVRIFLEDIEGRPLKVKGIEDVEGTAYLFEDWKQGNVTFFNNSVLSGVQLKFAVYGNQLFFKKGEDMLEFTMPVKEFTISSNNKTLLYRSLYPSLGENTTSTFYNVIADGKYQLLKLTTREIRDHKSYNEPVTKKFQDKEAWLVFSPTGVLQYAKPDKASLQTALPEKSADIERIIREKKLKLKNEADLITLFAELNK